MRITLIYVAACITLFVSCTSRMPEPITHEYSQQKKMQASNHWAVLAQDLANRINNQLISTDNIHRSVYVEQTCGDEATPCSNNETSTFNEAFRDLLVTGLYNYGIPTNSTPDLEAVEVLYKVQLVRHRSDRIRSMQPGLFTAISSAIVVLRDAPSALLILASGVAADVANTSMAIMGHYEVIITTSIIDKGKYLFRASDIYYINDKDFYHYQEFMPKTKSIKFSSKTTEKKLQQQELQKAQPLPVPLPEDGVKEDKKDI